MMDLRVMAFNIAEGTNLDAVALSINNANPNIVLLNEVIERRFIIVTEDQTAILARKTDMGHYKYEGCVALGLAGSKGVAILSMFELEKTQFHRVRYDNKDITFGILQATIQIRNLTHEVFSLRFTPLHTPAAYGPNEAGHRLARDLVNSIPGDRAVIFGGDFNADWSRSWSTEFRDTCGMTDVLVEHPDPGTNPATRVDYIYYRGPYKVDGAGMPNGEPGASDHPYVYAYLSRTDIPPPPPNYVPVPDVTGMSPQGATKLISEAGLKPQLGGTCDGKSYVSSQHPYGGKFVPPGTKVSLACKKGLPP